MKQVILWPIILAASLLVLLAAWLYFYQPKLVFYPLREFAVTPEQVGLNYEDVRIPVGSGERLHGWYFANAADTPGKPVVLFCHGNAGNISHRLETVDVLLGLGADILLFDYRGYGRSDGAPSESKAYTDAAACYRWLTEERGVHPNQIVLFGRSLGGAVAADLAQKADCRSLILESTFTNAADMAKRLFPYIPTALLRFRFDTMRKLPGLDCPILICHSPEDEIIPYDMGCRLFETARNPKRFVSLRGGHNDREYFTDSAYIEALREFLYYNLSR
ncbi:MAG: alpha/beta hydrolase [Candidatus Zixiibacteriota bacterium]